MPKPISLASDPIAHALPFAPTPRSFASPGKGRNPGPSRSITFCVMSGMWLLELFPSANAAAHLIVAPLKTSPAPPSRLKLPIDPVSEGGLSPGLNALANE